MPSSKRINPPHGFTFDQLEVGQAILGPSITVPEASIIDFARQWDPQPFHLDRAGAEDSVFGQLVGSGLQSILLSYWLYYQSGILRGTSVAGLGIDEVRFLKPLLPDDTLTVQTHIVEKIPSSKPDRGKVRLRVETLNQHDEIMFKMTILALIKTDAGLVD